MNGSFSSQWYGSDNDGWLIQSSRSSLKKEKSFDDVMVDVVRAAVENDGVRPKVKNLVI